MIVKICLFRKLLTASERTLYLNPATLILHMVVHVGHLDKTVALITLCFERTYSVSVEGSKVSECAHLALGASREGLVSAWSRYAFVACNLPTVLALFTPLRQRQVS